MVLSSDKSVMLRNMQFTTTGEQTHRSGHFSNLVTVTLDSDTFGNAVTSSSLSTPRYVGVDKVIKLLQSTKVSTKLTIFNTLYLLKLTLSQLSRAQ